MAVTGHRRKHFTDIKNMKKEKLSLCIIVGNVENYIQRFIKSFSPLVDEIVFVRAIGNQEADKTKELAEALGATFAGDYRNKHDWPHVDDFAAARQMAFDAASHEFIMWADTDDVIDPESIKRIRETCDLLPEDFDGIEIAYHVPEDGVTVMRERIIRKGRAKWNSPIHEYLQFFIEPKIAKVDGAVILHRPEGTRERNDERNLRILQSIAEPTTSHKFHLFQSLRATGQISAASNLICEMLADKSDALGKAEKYELFIAAGQMANDIEIRLQMNLQALSVDPARKEAYGELCLCYLGLNRNEDALAITTAMQAVSGGTGAWNVRQKYSGYLGIQLHGMALRANGFMDEADAIETNHFIRNGKKISLIHATRGRCKQAVDARRLWLTKAKNPDAIEHIFGLDADDPHGMFLSVHNHALTNGSSGSVAAWNAAAQKSCGEVLLQLSDDWNPPMHWDEILLNAIGDTSQEKVLAIGDGSRTDELLCMAIITRARYQKQGFMFHPEYFSVYSDDYFTQQAYADGVTIEARDIIFEHLHPVFGKAEMDEIYARSNENYRYAMGAGITKRLTEKTFVSENVHGWLDYRDHYDNIAKTLRDGDTFVEVGTWLGKSIIYLAQRLQDIGKPNVKIHCVDVFDFNGESFANTFITNIRYAKVDSMITIHETNSVAASELFAESSIDAIYIDAAHDYDSVKEDLQAWFGKVKKGGIFSGHDWTCADVQKAVEEHSQANGYELATHNNYWKRK
jgi:hypothetical protein